MLFAVDADDDHFGLSRIIVRDEIKVGIHVLAYKVFLHFKTEVKPGGSGKVNRVDFFNENLMIIVFGRVGQSEDAVNGRVCADIGTAVLEIADKSVSSVKRIK